MEEQKTLNCSELNKSYHQKQCVVMSAVIQVVIGELNEFDPSKSLEKNTNLLPDIKFSSVPFQIEYSVISRADKG